MAEIFNGKKSIKLKDNSGINEACEKIGVPFSCKDGTCATCMIEIKEGMENLSEMNDKEKNMGLEEPYRLACQCKIKKGKVSIGL